MGMTLAEKILARASGRQSVKAGDFVVASIDLAMTHEGLRGAYPVLKEAGVKKLWDPEKVVNLFDHWVPAPTVQAAIHHKTLRQAAAEFGIRHVYGENAGICHQVLPEKGHVVPGDLIVGTDSHTVTYGTFGAAATGIGYSEMAYVLATGKLWFRVPETIRFQMEGNLSSGVMSKDLLLYLAGKYSAEVAQYKAIEFSGSTAKKMSLSSRMTMSNMSVELGAKFGFFEPDEKVADFLKGRAKKPYALIKADPGASYEKVFQVDTSKIEPQVALPSNVDNVQPVSQLGKVTINQAFIGSCTNGRIEDLKIAAEILRGKKVNPQVRLLVIPASWEVYREALKSGILETLVDAGAIICNSTCGPCFGGHMGLLAPGERCVASINRNFQGRMGSSEAEVYLGSPATVASSAIEGVIADPRQYLMENK
ncbi:MAG: 3-isopropylmalate dehydratase large subunit [Deltaproteobacteria bacterium]|nr:3-isopropylmalate dehydratase large subunit [Deltaproteobacteria bacterium]